MSKYSSGCLSFQYDEMSGVVYRTLDFLGYSYYRVGDDGSVWSRMERKPKKGRGWITGIGNAWKRLKLVTPKSPTPYYKVVCLSKGYRHIKNWKVHRLVLLCFVGPCPPKMVGCHKNSSAHDNSVENLRWGTPKSNSLDRDEQGRSATAKLTPSQVRWIRRVVGSGDVSLDRSGARRIQGMLSKTGTYLTSGAILNVMIGETWRHIGCGTLEEELCKILQNKQHVIDAVLDGRITEDGVNIMDLLEQRLLEGKR